jgi:hypothetical protein
MIVQGMKKMKTKIRKANIKGISSKITHLGTVPDAIRQKSFGGGREKFGSGRAGSG